MVEAALRAAAGSRWSSHRGDGISAEISEGPEGIGGLLIRHGPGDHGLPAVEGPIGFVLDLSDGWRSWSGGLLLFTDGDSVRGWRPERGAVTLFDTARPPLLTLLGPGAGERLAVVGSWPSA